MNDSAQPSSDMPSDASTSFPHRQRICTLTRPHRNVWLVTINNEPDNRMTGQAFYQLEQCLDEAEVEWRSRAQPAPPGAPKGTPTQYGPGALVITSSIPKFFSNGLGLPADDEAKTGFMRYWETVRHRLLNYPLVTIAAINGHAFGGGLLFALCCDYRIMTSGKGLVSINELVIGLPLNASDLALLKSRLAHRPKVYREAIIGTRYTQAMALEAGFIDEIADDNGDHAKLVERAVAFGMEKSGPVSAGAWGVIKAGVHAPLWDVGFKWRQVKHVVVYKAEWEGKLRKAARLRELGKL